MHITLRKDGSWATAFTKGKANSRRDALDHAFGSLENHRVQDNRHQYRCALCGTWVDSNDIIWIVGKPYCYSAQCWEV